MSLIKCLRPSTIRKWLLGEPIPPEIQVPATLEECFAWLDANLGDEDRAAIKSGTDMLHFSLGRFLRNNWGLWSKESTLYKWFRDVGIWHADDMSGIIIESYRRKLNGEPLDLLGQVKYYQDYWAANGGQPA